MRALSTSSTETRIRESKRTAMLARARRIGGMRGVRLLDTFMQCNPPSADLLLESAFLLDRSGREREAIPRYRKAIALGLSDARRRDALICLASSLETAGNPRAAIRCLKRAGAAFEEDVAIDMFLASALQSCGKHAQAVALLARRILALTSDDPRVAAYAPVLRRKLRVRRNR